MKRSHEKIKDFVDAQPYDQVQNSAADLPRALAAYRFTDVTSVLVSSWLDTLANLPRNHGAARALAGVRGVGKSHTLAAFAALAAYPELRSSVPDAHVGTSARRLLSRRYLIVRVERGTRPTLLEELKAGFAESIGGTEADWSDDPAAILAVAASRISDTPLLLVIDTAFGREAHVRRDDGPLLTELARATQNVNAFIGLALDDDIEGADGANVGLGGIYHIDFLDPEHLYRVADTHLFQKSSQSRAALHEMYVSLRAEVPGFSWSEPRFASIYPVHPLVADIAAAVRLYAPSFAFLPFAASSVARSTNRPAQSLIALDEVFDQCDYELRKAEELKDALSVYDSLSNEEVGQLPIMQRLQAKLILKALFILSLDSRGATAREIGAAMLFYDEKAPDEEVRRIDETLSKLSSAAPEGSVQRDEEGAEVRYRFKILASAGFDTALVQRTAELAPSDSSISDLLRGIARARFADWPFTADNTRAVEAANLAVLWRGTSRYGKLVWQASEEGVGSLKPTPSADDTIDWEIVTLAPETVSGSEGRSPLRGTVAGQGTRFAVWQPAPLTQDEKDYLRRLVTLRTDASLFAEFGETARAAERTHTALAERCFARIYIDDARLLIGDLHRPFTIDARASKSLSEMLAVMLGPMLGVRFPQHPVFTGTLNEAEVANIVGGLFGGANPNDAHVQALAQHFAAPLGLASVRGGIYAPEAGDQVLKQPWVRQVLAITDAAGGGLVPLETIYKRLRAEPYGLQKEAQHLILAALVAQRRIELITQNNDRITRRTLDRRLRWDEIAGIARAAALLHSSEELTTWARLLTGTESLGLISEPGPREMIRAALWDWLNAWRGGNPLDGFASLDDEGLTTKTWYLAAAIRKSFGTACEAVEDALADNISLEEGLQRVADAFGDSIESFHLNTKLLEQLTSFTSGLATRVRARVYLATAEPTEVGELESARRELLTIARDVHSLLDQESIKRFDMLWREFHARYVEEYAQEHDATVGPSADRSALDSLLGSEDWRDFEVLSRLSIVNKEFWEEAQCILDAVTRSRCDLPVRRLLDSRPYCACYFRLARAKAPGRVSAELTDLVRRGLESHRQTLASWSQSLALALNVAADQHPDDQVKEYAQKLASRLALTNVTTTLSVAEIDLIELALQSGGVPPLRVEMPAGVSGLLTREELRARLGQWLNGLPDYPALVDVVSRSENNAG